MAWTLRISETARRQLKKLDRSTPQNLLRYKETAPAGDRRSASEREGPGGQPFRSRRYRVGDHRVICLIEDEQLVVLVVGVSHRSEAYR
ncbi:type II toxin-antitoxin system RelE family toxin [Cyanobium gracile]|uniref:type II toxin-antitoxin system RelE family toxin n=1 Tax=Cyanobium gracile TaxID=59930 RepID=UPI000900601F